MDSFTKIYLDLESLNHNSVSKMLLKAAFDTMAGCNQRPPVPFRHKTLIDSAYSIGLRGKCVWGGLILFKFRDRDISFISFGCIDHGLSYLCS